MLRCGQNIGHLGHFLAFVRENIGPSGYLSMNMAAWQPLVSVCQDFLGSRKGFSPLKAVDRLRYSGPAWVSRCRRLRRHRRLGRRLWLAWFAADLARRLLLLAGSAHVVLVGWFVSSDQNVTPAFSMKVRPGSG